MRTVKMKKLFGLLLFVMCMLVMTGCRDKQKEVEAIAPNIITAYLNRHIEDNSYSVHFKVKDNEVFTISSGEKSDTADNDADEALKSVSFYRQYNAINVKIDINNVEYNFEKDDKCIVTYDLKFSKKVLTDNVTGVRINSNLPIDWLKMSKIEKQNFKEKHYSLLLPYEFDYNYIYNITADLEINNVKLSVTLKYDPAKKIWKSNKYDYHKPLKAKEAYFLERDYSIEAAEEKLAKHDFIFYNNKFFLHKDNVEIQQKLDAGYVYLNGIWILRSDYNNLKDAAKLIGILNTSFDNPDVFLPTFNKILSIFKTHQDLRSKDRIVSSLNDIIVKYINGLKKYKNIVDVLIQVDENPDWSVLNVKMIRNTVGRKWESAIKLLLVMFEKEHRFDEFLKEYYYVRDNKVFDDYRDSWKPAFKTGMKKMHEKLKLMEKTLKISYRDLQNAGPATRERIFNDIKRNTAGFEHLNLKIKEYKNYMKIWELILSKDWKFKYDEIKDDALLKRIFADCPAQTCQKGMYFCKSCKNTRLCHLCNGRGVNFVPSILEGGQCRPDCRSCNKDKKEYTSFDDAEITDACWNEQKKKSNCSFCGAVRRWIKIHCRKDCRDCYRKGGKCNFCRGRGYVLRKNSDYFKNIHHKIMIELRQKIEDFYNASMELN